MDEDGLAPRLVIRLAVLGAILLLAALSVVVGPFPRVPSGPPSPDHACKGTATCITGQVTSIVDGDTLDVGPTRVRLALVDTPEAGQAGHQEAKDFTANFCPLGSTARVDEDDGQTGGSFGRMVAAVFCHGESLNAALLQAGLAVVPTQYCSASEFASEAWAAPYC